MAGLNKYDDLGTSRDVIDDEESNENTLVFPLNVYDSLQTTGSLKKDEKAGIVIAIWIVLSFLLAWFLGGWLRNIVPNYYVWIVTGVEVILQLTVGMYIVRFVLDEKSLFQELDKKDLIFSNYFKIYREIKSEEGVKYPFDILEFDDGSYGVFLQCRLGHNTQKRSNATYYANKDIQSILNKSGLSRKTYYHNESFKNSKAAKDLTDTLKNIKDPDLFVTYRDIVQNYLRIAEDESNVMAVTHLIYASSRIQKDELLPAINNILNVFDRDETVFREVSILNYSEIVEFLRYYYRLEILDMGIIRTAIAQKKSKFNATVTVVKLYGKNGKNYANENFKKLNAEVLNDFGLKR